MKNIVPDYRLDMVGEPCPYPAVATLEAMPQLKKGEILEVVSDCPQSINNIPLDARNHGYTVLDIQQDGPTISFFSDDQNLILVCNHTSTNNCVPITEINTFHTRSDTTHSTNG